MGLPPIVTLMAMYLGLNTIGLVGMVCFPIMIIIVTKLQEAGLIHIWKSADPAKIESNENPSQNKGEESGVLTKKDR